MNHHGKTGTLAHAAIAVTLAAIASSWMPVEAQAQTSAVGNANADSAAAGSRSRASDVGQATRTWLELQRTNASAAPALPTPGAQATLAYERYMDSFRRKIPASFGSALSGNSGASRSGYANPAAGGAQPSGTD
jgi:hypothetical protein